MIIKIITKMEIKKVYRKTEPETNICLYFVLSNPYISEMHQWPWRGKINNWIFHILLVRFFPWKFHTIYNGKCLIIKAVYKGLKKAQYTADNLASFMASESREMAEVRIVSIPELMRWLHWFIASARIFTSLTAVIQ